MLLGSGRGYFCFLKEKAGGQGQVPEDTQKRLGEGEMLCK